MLKRTLRAVWRTPTSRHGLLLIALLLLIAVLGPLLLGRDPNANHPEAQLAAPSWAHPFGTDQFGRDVLARVVAGARVSLAVGVGGCGLALLSGGLLGAIAGYAPAWLDETVMRVMDVIMSFPYLVLAIVLAFVVGPSLGVLILITAATRLPQFARLMRAGVLDVREREFVAAARVVGRRRVAILFRHVVPNSLAPVVAYASLAVGVGINIEAALSFLGIGIQPPTASWGTMLADGASYLNEAWWMSAFPGLAICLAILAFTLLGDGLREAMDPSRVIPGAEDETSEATPVAAALETAEVAR